MHPSHTRFFNDTRIFGKVGIFLLIEFQTFDMRIAPALFLFKWVTDRQTTVWQPPDIHQDVKRQTSKTGIGIQYRTDAIPSTGTGTHGTKTMKMAVEFDWEIPCYCRWGVCEQ